MTLSDVELVLIVRGPFLSGMFSSPGGPSAVMTDVGLPIGE